MDTCSHEIVVELQNGQYVTYCRKCGKIFDVKQPETIAEIKFDCDTKGGTILHG